MELCLNASKYISKNMKQKKLKSAVPSAKRQAKQSGSMAPMTKQFQLLYRTCDKLPSSEQYQSVFFLKRKKICHDDDDYLPDRKIKKKFSKKKKVEPEINNRERERERDRDRVRVDELGQTLKKSLSLSVTKSTMPSTLAFKKSTFADSFKDKICLEKSSIRRINNLSNSNSSRYLTSKYPDKQKSPIKTISSPEQKQVPKSPSKQPTQSTPQKLHKPPKRSKPQKVQNLEKSPTKKNHLNSHPHPPPHPPSSKKSKNRTLTLTTTKQAITSQFEHQYLFVDGKYVEVDEPVTLQIEHRIARFFQTSPSALAAGNRRAQNGQNGQNGQRQGEGERVNTMEDNQFMGGSCGNRGNHQNGYQPRTASEISLTESEKVQVQMELISKIVLIQRWWRTILEFKQVEQCNNVKHFTSKAQSLHEFSDSPQGDPLNQSQPQSPTKPRSPPTPSSLFPETEPQPYKKPESLPPTHQQQPSQTPQAQPSESQQQSQPCLSYPVPNFVQTRQSLIHTNFQSQKMVIQRMLELHKISIQEYTQNLIHIQSNYQAEMLEVNQLKFKAILQAGRIHSLKAQIIEKQAILANLHVLPAKEVLGCIRAHAQHGQQEIIQPYQEYQQRNKSNGYHYSDISQDQPPTSPKPISYRKPPTSTQFPPPPHSLSTDTDSSQISLLSNPDKLQQLLLAQSNHQYVVAEIEKRYTEQLGIGYECGVSKLGSISTSALSIHTFLTNFLRFYEYFYKQQLLNLINLPYGYNQLTRLKLLQSQTPPSSLSSPSSLFPHETLFRIEKIISQQILQDFHQHQYPVPPSLDENMREMIWYEKIHHQAIVDCFNQCLNCFRPYFFIGGAPYAWNYSEKALTFYYIAQDNIQEVFEKTQYKVLKTASNLCGVLIQPLQPLQPLEPTLNSFQSLLYQKREQKLQKVEQQELEQLNFQWAYFEEDKTAVLLQLAEIVFVEMMVEAIGDGVGGDREMWEGFFWKLAGGQEGLGSACRERMQSLQFGNPNSIITNLEQQKGLQLGQVQSSQRRRRYRHQHYQDIDQNTSKTHNLISQANQHQPRQSSAEGSGLEYEHTEHTEHKIKKLQILQNDVELDQDQDSADQCEQQQQEQEEEELGQELDQANLDTHCQEYNNRIYDRYEEDEECGEEVCVKQREWGYAEYKQRTLSF